MSSNKAALQGFSRFKLFPIVTNTTSAYEVSEGFDIPWAQKMTKEVDKSSTAIYGDDMKYLEITNWNGLNSTITFVEVSLPMMAKLGFGEYDEDTKELKWNPQGKSLEFGATFRCLQAGGSYRMYRMYRFVVSAVEETEIQTKGDSAGVSSYNITGVFTARSCDSLPGMIHDGDDMSWLDEIPTV